MKMIIVRQGGTIKAILVILVTIIWLASSVDAETQMPPQLRLPLKDSDIGVIHLTTSAGGTTSVPGKIEGISLPPTEEVAALKKGYYVDPYHAPKYIEKGIEKKGAYYALDFGGPKGTPILAAAGGKIIDSGNHPVVGKYVLIQHENNYYTLYEHLNDLTVKKVDVKQGEQIGTLGGTGSASVGGDHLHFQVLHGKVPVGKDIKNFGWKPYINSHYDNEALAQVKIEGTSVKDFKLKYDEKGVPQKTNVVDALKSANMSLASKQTPPQQINSSAQIALQDFEKITKTAHTTPMQVVNLLPDKDKLSQRNIGNVNKLDNATPQLVSASIVGTTLHFTFSEPMGSGFQVTTTGFCTGACGTWTDSWSNNRKTFTTTVSNPSPSGTTITYTINRDAIPSAAEWFFSDRSKNLAPTKSGSLVIP